MRSFVVGVLALVGLVAPAGVAADGTLDTSFGGTGSLSLDLVADYEEQGRDVVVDDQGRIVVLEVARYSNSSYQGTFVARFLPDGTLDTSFSAGDDLYPDGIKDIGEITSLNMLSLTIDSQDRIVLAGWVESPPNENDVMVARLTPQGTYDTSFGGGDGRVREDISAGSYDLGGAVAVDSQDRILVTASYQVPMGPPRGVVGRFTTTGQLDNSFGGGWVDPFGSPTETTGFGEIAVDPEGRIVLSAYTPSTGLDHFGAVRLMSDGTKDPAFGGDGIVELNFDPEARESSEGVHLDGEGRILLSGNLRGEFGGGGGRANDTRDVAAARLLSDGTLDPAYGNGGMARATMPAQLRSGSATLDRAGRIVSTYAVTTGAPLGSSGGSIEWSVISRFRADGTFDTSFGQNGLIEVSRPDKRLFFNAVTTDIEGRYLFAGAEIGDDNSNKLVLSRYDVAYPTNPPSVIRKCAGTKATIVGNARANRLKGTRKRDVIAGLGGNDVIKGLKGNDLICGGAGNDTLIGGPGKDKLIGDKGRDKLVGGPGEDRLIGGKGRDHCLAGKGRGRITGCERRR